jgi:hypothetical protein
MTNSPLRNLCAPCDLCGKRAARIIRFENILNHLQYFLNALVDQCLHSRNMMIIVFRNKKQIVNHPHRLV